MPSDITGTEVLEEDPDTGRREFRFLPGPIFANMILADEINRTPPKTQAALLEAMQERQVTVGGQHLQRIRCPSRSSCWPRRTRSSRKAPIRCPRPSSTASCSTSEQYLKPEVIRQISRLDLRAQFIVKGFLQGLHASPFHGFSVEFSEHRKYTPGDDPQDIDWLVYAKTDKYYIKKFEAETNITGYLVMDLSRSMGYTYRQQLTKFDYAICLAAALCYLMVHQQDPVGLITFDEKIRQSLPPRSKRTQLGNVLSLLANLQPTGQTDIARSLTQIAAMLRHRSLVMLFTDLLADPEPVIQACTGCGTAATT
jgi:uncharacterized protein (DUF58 family)